MSITNKLAIKAFNRTLRDICDTFNIILKGILFLGGGDFTQTLLVVKNGNRVVIVAVSLRQSSL
jgi:PIF1-like helicase